MSAPAELRYCRQLYMLTGWEVDRCWWRDVTDGGGHHWLDIVDSKFTSSNPDEKVIAAPAYGLGYLTEKAFEIGLVHVKIKQAEGGVIVTAPPCYHVEGSTPATTLAKLLIRAIKKQRAAEKDKAAA